MKVLFRKKNQLTVTIEYKFTLNSFNICIMFFDIVLQLNDTNFDCCALQLSQSFAILKQYV